MNTDPQLSQLRLEVLALYDGHCALCYHRAPAVLHEEPPRSLNPRWKSEPWTWYALCPACHTIAHNTRRDIMESKLEAARVRYFPQIKERIHDLTK